MPKLPEFNDDLSKLEIDCRIKTVREDNTKDQEDAHSFSFSGPSETKDEEQLKQYKTQYNQKWQKMIQTK